MRPRACGALIRDRKILMVHHVHDGKDYWTLPGGHVGEGESFEEAAAREMREEVGLETRAIRLLWERQKLKDGSVEKCFLMEMISEGRDVTQGIDPEQAHLSPEKRMLKEPFWWPLDDMRDDVQVSQVLRALGLTEKL